MEGKKLETIKMDKIEQVIEANKEYWRKNTIKNFKSRLKKYFEIIGCDPEDYFKDKENHDYKADIEKAWKQIVGKPPGTRNSFISCLKTFLMHNGVEFEQLYWKTLRKKGRGKRAVTQDKVPTNQEFKQMLLHTDIRGKALFIVSAVSGTRIDSELLKITWDDVDLNTHPKLGIITISGMLTKSGDPRTCFITKEAKDMLLEWKKERGNYLESIKGKCNFYNVDYEVKLDDPRIFPFHYTSALRLFHRMIENAGFTEKDNTTKRYRYHIHALRKFAKTRLNLSGVPEKITNWIVGHEGYMSEYDRPTTEELIPHYLKASDSMAIFEAQPDLSGVQEELNDVRSENIKMKQEIDRLRLDLLEVKFSQAQELQRKERNK